MENSRQNTRFHWRNAKRLERLSKIMDTTDDGASVKVAGDLEVKTDLYVHSGFVYDQTGETISVTQEMKDAISGNNEVVISITDDDWDETNETYVKHVELNNTYISFDFTGTHPFSLVLYCPYFKGLTAGYNTEIINDFTGIGNEPNSRYVSIASNVSIAIFNGIVNEIITSM